MPALSMFFGIIIYMYRERGTRHNQPHIHVEYQDFKAAFSLEGDLIDGELPRKKVHLVKAWIEIHHEELVANWNLLLKGDSPFKIEPLR